METEKHLESEDLTQRTAKWRRFLELAPRSAVRRIAGLIHLDEPPDLAQALLNGFSNSHPELESLPSILLAHGLVERAVSDPTLLNTEQAVQIAQAVLVIDPYFDSKLLGSVGEQNAKPHQVNRVLVILNRLHASKPYIIMPVLRLLNSGNPMIRAEAARIVGRASTNFDLIEGLLADQDPRVTSSLLQSFSERSDLASADVGRLLRLAVEHSHPRVQSIATVLLSRLGDAEALARLDAMLNSEDARSRTSARGALDAFS